MERLREEMEDGEKSFPSFSVVAGVLCWVPTANPTSNYVKQSNYSFVSELPYLLLVLSS